MPRAITATPGSVDRLADELEDLLEVHSDARLPRVALRHLTLMSGKGSENLALLALRPLEDVKRSPKFSRDFVELSGRDLQFAMGFF